MKTKHIKDCIKVDSVDKKGFPNKFREFIVGENCKDIVEVEHKDFISHIIVI